MLPLVCKRRTYAYPSSAAERYPSAVGDHPRCSDAAMGIDLWLMLSSFV